MDFQFNEETKVCPVCSSALVWLTLVLERARYVY